MPQVRSSLRLSCSCIQAAALFLAIAVLLPAAAWAVEHQVRILLDLDNDAATGCLVNTVDGPFDGVEQILITTVETTSPPEAGTVTDAALSECTDSVANTFSAPASFDGGWPVGIGNGVGGRDVVETYAPLASLVVSDPLVVRLGVVVTDELGGEQALLTQDDAPDGPAILLSLGSAVDIPTTGEWGLLLLSLLLATVAVRALGRRGAVAVLLVVLVLGAGVAWAAGMLDGLTGDWSPGDQLGSDGIVLFGKGGSDALCFRVDVDLLFNSPPEAQPDSFATDEDTVLLGENVLADNGSGVDSDPNSDPITVTAFDAISAQGATVTVAANGDLTYDPTGAAALQALDDGNMVDDTFTYTIEDPSMGSDTATVTVAVSGVNDAPVALQDMYETDEDTPLVIGVPGVLVNDGDVDSGDPLVAVLDTDVANGSLTLSGDGSFSYAPDLDFNGTDSFTYHASDGTADSTTVTATITVGAVNDGPNAVDDAFMTDEDTPLVIAAPGVLMNDTDPENDPLTVTAFDATGTEGTVTVNADGSFTYDPTGSAVLQALDDLETFDDTFTYTIDDGSMSPDTATVTITVSGANDAPLASDDAYSTDEDTPLMIGAPGVLANDTDVDVETLSAVPVSGPSNAAAFTLNADGSFSYTPTLDFNGSDSFTYRANDGTVNSNLATVTITVNPVNDPPTADNEVVSAACNVEDVVETAPGQAAAATGNVFRTVADNVLDGDSDPVEMTAIAIVQADGLTSDNTAPFQVTTNQGGSVTLFADGSFVFTPEAGDRSVADSFTYTIQDADGGQAVGTVTLNVGSVCVWFVDSTGHTGADDNGTGTSSDPFASLVDEEPDGGPGVVDDAQDAAQASDVIYVFAGPSASSPYVGGYQAKANQRILGEGVDLVVDLGFGPETLFDSAANTPPLVDAPLDAFTVQDVTGVEIAGFEIEADDNAVEAVSTPTTGSAIGLSFHDNAISRSANQGIRVSNGIGDSTVALIDNTIVATGSGIEATATAGTLALAVDGNTGITSGGVGISLTDNNGSGTSLFVTSFCGNAVSGDTVGAGVVAQGVIFDAAPLPGGDADFTGDQVACTATTTSVGSSGNPVGGSAMVLDTVSGDLAFGTLDLYTDGTGTIGLDVTGTGPLMAAAGTGFEISSTGGTASSANGPAVAIDPATVGLTFTTVSSTGSPGAGVSLVDVTGSFTAGSASSITGSTGNAFHLASALMTALDVTYHGTINNASARLLSVDGLPTGSDILFDGTSLSDTGGTGIAVNAFDGIMTVTATTTTITSSTSTAFAATGDTDGTVILDDVTITNPAGTAVHIVDGGDLIGGTFDFNNVDVSQATNNARLVDIQGLNGGSVDFDSASALVATDGTGINVSSNAGTSPIAFNGTVDLGTSGSRISDGTAFTMTGNSAGTGVTAPDVDVFTSGQTAVGATGGGTLDVDALSINTVSNGRAIDLDGIVSKVDVDSVTCSNNSNCVDLTSLGATSVTTFAGAGLTCTGGTCFNASAARTVEVTGTGNTISATNAIGLNLTNTTVGANKVTWQSISSSGAANGIVLATTGSAGAFEVTGTGSTDASGGTIQTTTADAVSANNVRGGLTLRNMVLGDATASLGQPKDATNNIGGDGIDLSGVDDVVLTNLRIARTNDHGIDGTDVTNFSISDSEIFNAGDDNGDSGISFEGVGNNNLDGIATVTNTVIDGAVELGMRVQNSSGTLSLSVTGSQFSGTANTASLMFGEDGLQIEVLGSAQTTASISGSSTFSMLESDGIMATTSENGAAVLNITIDGNTFTGFDNGAPNMRSDNAIELNATGGTNAANSPDLRYTINGNTINASSNSAILIGANDFTNVDGRITNNMIDGSLFGFGIEAPLSADDNSVARLLVTGNTISNHNQQGAFFNANNSGDLDITFNGNTVSTQPTDSTAFENASFQVTSGTLCVATSGNTVALGGADAFGSGVNADALAVIRSGGTAQLEVGGANLADPASTVLSTNNPAAASVFAGGTISIVANATCATPIVTPLP